MKKILIAALLLIPLIASSQSGTLPQKSGNLTTLSVTSTLNLSDDVPVNFGAGSPTSCRWETADANANELVCFAPEGGSTDVPGLVWGDISISNVDLGLFNGQTDPFLAVMSDAGTKGITLSHNGTNGVIGVTSGTISVPAGITAALTGNASTSTALAANPADCSANSYATTIAASGDLTCSTVSDAGVVDALTISGGTVNNSVIGGSTPAAATVTTLSAAIQADLTAGSCTANQIRFDTGGAAAELCFCAVTNTWSCVTMVPGGPVD